MHVIGTAGHVDHGKSALIAALTGTNPDRLAEEQARGMTLDLGFAHLRFADGLEAGIVDVPGHERFLHNMLAGAAGMELVLLVVDACEGVMPQTVEHLAILRLLDVRSAIVAVSKIDLVEPQLRAAACRRIREQLRGTIAADAVMIGVSALTGEHLDVLEAALHDRLSALPPRNAAAPVYLPIDRAFVLPGLGTVVTGTLMQGTIAVGETLVLEPSGAPAHVRSIGVFATTRARVEAGSRVALSLPGIDRRDAGRGRAVVGRELRARSTLQVRFEPLPGVRHVLRRRTPVRAYIGAAEILGTLVAEGPFGGEHAFRAQLCLRDPVVAFAGLRFVVRRPSPMTLLGGGCVEGVEPASPAASRPGNEAAVLAVLGGKQLEALELAAIARDANLREHAAAQALDRLVERDEAVRVSRPPAYVDGASAAALLDGMLAQLEAAHRQEPWAMGMTSIALSRTIDVPEPILVRVAEHFVQRGRLLKRGGYYALPNHRPAPTAQQLAFFDALVPVDEEKPLLPIPFAGAAAAVRRSQLAGLSKAFETMLAQGALVKVGDDVYRADQIAQIRARVAAHFRERPRMTASQFRDMLATSRKYAVPLLEWLDAHEVTIRDGDYRRLRRRIP